MNTQRQFFIDMIVRRIVFVMICFLAGVSGYAQQEPVGSVAAFYNFLKPSAGNMRLSTPVQKALKIRSGESVGISIHHTRETEAGEVLIGKALAEKTSYVFFTYKNGSIKGKVILPDKKKAYTYSTVNGNVYVAPEPIDKAMCVEYQLAASSPASSSVATALPPPTSPVFNLQSLPGATAVVMLDFDGHDATGSFWGNIVALPADMTVTDIEETWKVLAEDFMPYQLNVTTSEAVYQAAPANRRMRCVVTPTTDAAPGFGGVAFIGSFTTGGELAPCWVFNGALSNGSGGQLSGETASHEVGHTMGLNHDGREVCYESLIYL